MGRFISTGSGISPVARRWPRKSKRCWTRKRKRQRRRRLKKIPKRSQSQNQTRKRNRRRMVVGLWQAVSREARCENIKFQFARVGVGFGSGGVAGISSVDAECCYNLCD